MCTLTVSPERKSVLSDAITTLCTSVLSYISEKVRKKLYDIK